MLASILIPKYIAIRYMYIKIYAYVLLLQMHNPDWLKSFHILHVEQVSGSVCTHPGLHASG